MYCLSDKQIDYILNDISARGVEMVGLQQNLLDHICCIVEQNLEENGDFECFYQTTIQTFYKDELWEIEEETLSLLLFKNYYTMKKIMLTSGLFSALTMTFGILFKFMHWPGTLPLILLGALSGTFIFIPLLVTLKMKEKQDVKDKAVLATGAFAAILVSFSFLSRVMLWPFSIEILYASTVIMMFVFLPVFFFAGIRNPITKLNTITSSILIVITYGLLLLMVRTPQSTFLVDVKNTQDYVRSQKILQIEQKQLADQVKSSNEQLSPQELGNRIDKACEDIKAKILEQETGEGHIDENFESKRLLIRDKGFYGNHVCFQRLSILSSLIKYYNEQLEVAKNPGITTIPVRASFMELTETGYSVLRTLDVLNQLTQVQMFVLQNEREALAEK